jgi:hypothetical protein
MTPINSEGPLCDYCGKPGSEHSVVCPTDSEGLEALSRVKADVNGALAINDRRILAFLRIDDVQTLIAALEASNLLGMREALIKIELCRTVSHARSIARKALGAQ